MFTEFYSVKPGEKCHNQANLATQALQVKSSSCSVFTLLRSGEGARTSSYLWRKARAWKVVVLARHECLSDLLTKEKKDRRGPNYMYIPMLVHKHNFRYEEKYENFKIWQSMYVHNDPQCGNIRGNIVKFKVSKCVKMAILRLKTFNFT